MNRGCTYIMSAKDREGVKKWSDIDDIINEQTLCRDIKLMIIVINSGFDSPSTFFGYFITDPSIFFSVIYIHGLLNRWA